MTNDQQAPAVVIERTIGAPIEQVWAMWTDPEHFAQWYGPTGTKVSVLAFDVRPGGTRTVGMEVQTPEGSREMWFSGIYLDVVPHERLRYTEFIADREGNQLSPDGAPHAVTEVQVAFRPMGSRTELVLTHLGIPAGSPGAVGWQMALDELASYVKINT